MVYEFRYLAPKSVGRLCAALTEHAGAAKLLAGGTDLLPNIRNGVFKPDYVIDLKLLPGAAKLQYSQVDGLIIGPAVTINDLLRQRSVRRLYPVLCDCAHQLASHQIRNRATVAGNVVNASPCSDMAPALLCLDAVAVIRSAAGQRQLPFSQFFTGVKKTALLPGEFLEKIIVPAASSNASGRYLKLKRIAGHDLGIVGVLCTLHQGRRRYAVSSAAPTPVLVDGFSAGDGPEDVERRVLAAVSPISDVRASQEYRRHMIAVYARQLLQEVR
ncbi:MAG: molybdopterin dehydrogenase [Spirochaetes bacterium GWD1_61_31]|nr:MAG: molybdopterin dehydrogenase [Spirochaetes bacterium GWB1_60_80]OHD35165.1 MAG: molybdopterin dehydrogenase [Spirochaetes bacterium GWC1_61_12]OHD43080.1 MAG: molybdopterin dehydrogenase [Spirochaetes bacterium GWE1_60_18]OHD43522.1 MAG: molybdopterin dehydrogenase [Spirochaetes bacterium GWD1_61_31]OHD59675.1 MAG: molybdopterin dehydrogenase [Spirochaetes bacterium GWF1_60_12]HAP44095.1 molybdopterin dehydrogenase [Spirochaetaceae bacterium]